MHTLEMGCCMVSLFFIYEVRTLQNRFHRGVGYVRATRDVYEDMPVGVVTDDGMQTRAHLETQLASALALKSPNEYRQCLLSYIRFLAREADESRLREVCESFLGPPTGMAEAVSSDPKNPAWDPCVLVRLLLALL
ncbi:hypothetical protein TEA_020414 [Camellia sinensis var. sinensis]|uniref:Protein HIRA-like C-terminal domain-containing protein n=1 Tax=Camellia sinensis var. sinensis TaxID=542762 RepID=A0A4S4CZ58_CAMSN|nr:hypothetical protein TEA_020414 [Camellia sinensis var. sinensis]